MTICTECGHILDNVKSDYCPGCGSDKFRRVENAKASFPSRFAFRAPTTY